MDANLQMINHGFKYQHSFVDETVGLAHYYGHIELQFTSSSPQDETSRVQYGSLTPPYSDGLLDSLADGHERFNFTFHASPPSQAPYLAPAFHPNTNYPDRKSTGLLSFDTLTQEHLSETPAFLSADSSISDQQEVKEAYLMRTSLCYGGSL
ncbi:uncharacterized protein N7483_010401 [Penicillium malachiteum]|uniref:uncharacterized protein n=1 Tax=Penicillium malachiteum TaxID=1324776 RepID=UPI0025475FD9|nr:uncharacterized protein N7483_010401 [Penicillium malachiteum]KAJ5713220.1 hypothetical protein N7483_010401 [Penicillium malachiteum]